MKTRKTILVLNKNILLDGRIQSKNEYHFVYNFKYSTILLKWKMYLFLHLIYTIMSIII